ncbi:hypothetical protein MJD09_26380 [bacterium]|nr:hypothetical protein [bacterium]
MIQSVIGTIMIGGLLIFCVLALIIPIVVELGKLRQHSVAGNRHRIFWSILAVTSFFLFLWLIK